MRLKRVSHIDGRLVLRPAFNHPNPQHWQQLREQVKQIQNNECGVCWRSGQDYRLELHHRHYDTFGNESLSDVVMLCSSCHEAITSVIRARRNAMGDQTLGTGVRLEQVKALARPKHQQQELLVTQPDVNNRSVFRPAFCSYGRHK